MRLFFITAILVCFGLAFVFIAVAKTNESRVTLSRDQVHEGLFFAGADTIIIDGVVNGDAYLAGNRVIVNGAINGDLFVGGNLITISGRVSDDVRVAGSDIEVSGVVGKNIAAAGRAVLLANDSDVRGSVLVAAQTFSSHGSVGKEMLLGAQNMLLNGVVGGDIRAFGESVTVQRDAKIAGSLEATVRPGNLVVVDGSLVEGGIVERQPQRRPESALKDTFNVFGAIWLFLSIALVGVIMLAVTPRQGDALLSLLQERPFYSLGWGVAWMLVTPIIVVALFISIVGIIIGALLGFIYIYSLIISHVIIAYLIGNRFAVSVFKGRPHHRIWRMLIGLLIYYLLFSIPIVGPVIMVIGMIFALGAMVVLGRHAMIRLHHRARAQTS